MAGNACDRVGPGRLPWSDRRDIGGAITMAANGLLVAGLWFGIVGWLLWSGRGGTDLAFYFGFGLFFLPGAALATVIIGFLLWRYLYDASRPRTCGLVFGLLTGAGSLVTGALWLGTLMTLLSVSRGYVGVIEGVGLGLLVTIFAMLFAFIAVGWILLPVYAVGGWYHERATRG